MRLIIASRLRALVARIRNRGARIDLARIVYLGPLTDLRIDRGATFVAGARTHFRRNCVVEVHRGGRVEVGADTQFTYNCVIQCSTSIVIGERCTFAAGALLVDGNHRFRDANRSVREQGYDFRPLRIGDDVWVGAGAVVMADLGDRAVVGAGAVVVEPVPPYTVVAGVPARVISTFGP
jgi:acetyltransferase-like isoleucine patch superfamily enzyme